ncbi:MAG TPA: sugar phosphate isomerase/epimerase [Vicinamibacterales bacterium]|nr:sugar phosphate isomerase/epimerase [Vicinamibacterales bacterium]
MKRRDFVRQTTLATAGLVIGNAPRLSAQTGAIQFGYAAITWQGQDRQAIDEVSAVGFKGIQLRTSALPEFGDTPGALKELLKSRGLTMVAFSSGNVRIDPQFEAEDIDVHMKHARFVRDVGGLYLQLTDTRPKRALVAADYQRLGRLLTEIGKRTADIGIPVAYHNHMNNIGERPEEVDRVLDATDPRYVKVLLDIAHYQQGGGDPVRAVRRYADRILFLHIKDVQSPLPGNTGDPMRSYRFVEIGRGKVDVKGVFAALAEVRFKGWAIVELDAVPDKARTPKESAIIARQYLQQLGFEV